MALPERSYYSLTGALKEINKNLNEKHHLDIEDLFHFAFTGKLEICTLIDYIINDNQPTIIEDSAGPYKIHYNANEDKEPFLIYFKSNPDYKNELCDLLDNIIDSDSNIIKGNCGYFSIDGYSLCDDDLTVVIESKNISLLVAVHQNFFSPVLAMDQIDGSLFNIPRTFELSEDNCLYKYSKLFDFLYYEKGISESYKNLHITKQELDRFIQQAQGEDFTIEDYQKILYSLKELVCSKTKKWSQDTINNELDGIQKGMSKRRLESLWSTLNKTFKSK